MPAPQGSVTGGARFRTGFGGRLVLQVEDERPRDRAMGGDVTFWRDATERDLYRLRHMRKQRGLEPLI